MAHSFALSSFTRLEVNVRIPEVKSTINLINEKGICIPLCLGVFDEFYKNGNSVMEFFCSPSTSFEELRLDEDTVLLGFYLHGKETVKIIRRCLDCNTVKVNIKFKACENLLNMYQAVINAV